MKEIVPSISKEDITVNKESAPTVVFFLVAATAVLGTIALTLSPELFLEHGRQFLLFQTISLFLSGLWLLLRNNTELLWLRRLINKSSSIGSREQKDWFFSNLLDTNNKLEEYEGLFRGLEQHVRHNFESQVNDRRKHSAETLRQNALLNFSNVSACGRELRFLELLEALLSPDGNELRRVKMRHDKQNT